MALLLQRASVLRQSSPVRDHSDLRPDAVALGVHRDEETAAGAGETGKGQVATGKTHAHPHTLSQVRKAETPTMRHTCTALLSVQLRSSVASLVFFASGSCPCWRRRCTATALPSGAKTSWQELQEGRYPSAQVTPSQTDPPS